MTKIDFYITNINTLDDYWNFACRLTEKAFRKQCDVYLHTANEEHMAAVDKLLWTFRPNSFLPHSSEINSEINSEISSEMTGKESEDNSKTDSAASATGEILVACSGDPRDHHDVLVNLTEQTPECFSRFTRVAEVVMGTDEAKAKSRQRYKYYRDRGYPLEVHNL
ncbi:MAG TPA: DNA polymerase III subunit chi [Cellvibrionales bacterium]|jgi:DNA polymerase-3 subunit chi|nr:DNA polymerase III subunit chi [Cellvibrionales bacterium]